MIREGGEGGRQLTEGERTWDQGSGKAEGMSGFLEVGFGGGNRREP